MPAADGLGNKIYIGDYVLRNIHTEQVEQTVLMDDTNVDHIANQVSITVTGTVHTKDPEEVLHGISAGDAMVNLQTVCEIFNSQRLPFKWTVGDIDVFAIWPVETFGSRTADGTTWYADVGDGPVIESNVTNVIADVATRIRVTVRFTYQPCANQIERVSSNPVMSLRWAMADDIDCRTWLTVRTYRGHCRLISRTISPHIFRYVVLPPVQLGFRRQKIRYNETDDGRTLEWQVIDEEVYIQPPFPSSEWSGTSSVTTGLPTAGVKGVNQGTVNVIMTAPKNVDKRHLIQVMVYVMNAKTNFLHVSLSWKAFVQSVTFTEELATNTVGANLSVMYAPGSSGDGVGGILFKVLNETFGQNLNGNTIPGIGFAPPYDPHTPTFTRPGTHLLAGIFIPALQNPCLSNRAFIGGTFDPRDRDGKSEKDGQGGLEPQNPAITTEEDPNLGFSNDPLRPYMDYKITQKYYAKYGNEHGAISFITEDDPPNEAAIFNFHQPLATKTIRFQASRVNAWPIMPGAIAYSELSGSSEIRHVPMEFDIEFNSATPSADGDGMLYSVGGELSLAMSRPYQDGEAIMIPRAPNIGVSPKLGSDPGHITQIPGDAFRAMNDAIFTTPGLIDGGGDTGGPGAGGGPGSGV